MKFTKELRLLIQFYQVNNHDKYKNQYNMKNILITICQPLERGTNKSPGDN